MQEPSAGGSAPLRKWCAEASFTAPAVRDPGRGRRGRGRRQLRLAGDSSQGPGPLMSGGRNVRALAHEGVEDLWGKNGRRERKLQCACLNLSLVMYHIVVCFEAKVWSLDPALQH